MLENAVVGQQHFEVIDFRREGVAPDIDIIDQLRRQVLVHAADAEERCMHARAGRALIEHHQLFAFLETPQRRRQRTDVHRLRGHVQEMRQDAADLAVEHADQLRPPRHLDAEQLFRGETECVFLIHRRDIVEPVEIRDRLQIGLGLDQLLGAAMQKSDMRIDTFDDFAVKLQHQAQHAVRGRMLRAEVDGEISHSRDFGHQLPAFGAGLASAFSSPGSG